MKACSKNFFLIINLRQSNIYYPHKTGFCAYLKNSSRQNKDTFIIIIIFHPLYLKSLTRSSPSSICQISTTFLCNFQIRYAIKLLLSRYPDVNRSCLLLETFQHLHRPSLEATEVRYTFIRKK